MAVWEIGAASRGTPLTGGTKTKAPTGHGADDRALALRKREVAPARPPALVVADPARTFARLLGNRAEVGAVSISKVGGGVATAIAGPVIGGAVAAVGAVLDAFMAVGYNASGDWIDLDGTSDNGRYPNGKFDLWGGLEIPWSMPPADLDDSYEALGRLILADWEAAGRPADWCPLFRSGTPGGWLTGEPKSGLTVVDAPSGSGRFYRLGSAFTGPWLNTPPTAADQRPFDLKNDIPAWTAKPLSSTGGWPTSQPYESFTPFMVTTKKNGHRIFATLGAEEIPGIARLLNTIARTAIVRWSQEKTGTPALLGFSISPTANVVRAAKAGNKDAQREVESRAKGGDKKAVEAIEELNAVIPRPARRALWWGGGLTLATLAGLWLARRRREGSA
jgi:hypothetical protein